MALYLRAGKVGSSISPLLQSFVQLAGVLTYRPLLRAVDGGILRLLFNLRTLLPALRSPEMERFAGLGAEAAASQCCFQQPAGVFHW